MATKYRHKNTLSDVQEEVSDPRRNLSDNIESYEGQYYTCVIVKIFLLINVSLECKVYIIH